MDVVRKNFKGQRIMDLKENLKGDLEFYGKERGEGGKWSKSKRVNGNGKNLSQNPMSYFYKN